MDTNPWSLGTRTTKDEGRAHWEGEYNGVVDGYEREEVEDEGDAIDETHEHGELVYETCKLEELERMANERGHALEHRHYNGAQGTNEHGHDKDNDVPASTRAYTWSTPTLEPDVDTDPPNSLLCTARTAARPT